MIKKSKNAIEPGKYLSVSEQKKLFAYLYRMQDIAHKRNTHRAITNRFIVELIIKTGMWADDLQSIKIRDLPCHHGNPVIYLRDDNGEIVRAVVISKALCESIVDYIRTCRKNSKPGSYLVANERGGRMTYHSLYSKLQIIGRQAGLVKLTSRLLRTLEVDSEILAANHQQQVEKLDQIFANM